MSIILVSGTCFLNFFSSLCVFQSVKIFLFNISSRLYRKYHVFIKNRSIFCTGFVKFFQVNLSSLYSFGQDQDLFIQLQRLSQTKFFSIVYILVIPLLSPYLPRYFLYPVHVKPLFQLFGSQRFLFDFVERNRIFFRRQGVHIICRFSYYFVWFQAAGFRLPISIFHGL